MATRQLSGLLFVLATNHSDAYLELAAHRHHSEDCPLGVLHDLDLEKIPVMVACSSHTAVSQIVS